MIKYCPVCKKEYKGRNKYTCSMECFAKYKTQTKVCIVCGKEFNDPQSNLTKTCSEECSSIHRKQLHADGKYAGTLEKAHEVAKIHPLTGRFETHMHAKTWKIQSPSGEIFECKNLKLWISEHLDLFDGTLKQAYDGIIKIKHSTLGKRKNKSYQWKGWRLLEWVD